MSHANNRDKLRIIGQPPTLTEAIKLLRPHLADGHRCYLVLQVASSIDRGTYTQFRVDVRRSSPRPARQHTPRAKATRVSLRLVVYGITQQAQIDRLQEAFPDVPIEHRIKELAGES